MNTTPAEPEPDASADPSRSELRWLILAVAALLLLGALCWWAYLPAANFYHSWQVQRHLAPLQGHLDRKDWRAAASILHEARRSAPDHPAVLRGSLDFLTRLGQGDPRDTLLLVQKLQHLGEATAQDLALLGQAQVRLGEVSQGQKVYDALPEQDRKTHHGLELLAALLEAKGQTKPAAEARREALLTRPDDADSLRQLARLDLRDSSADRREAVRARLWKLARVAGTNQLLAVEMLALHDRHLTAPQAEELRQIVARAGGSDAARLQVISAQMRISPQLRSRLIDDEITTWKDRPPVQASSLLVWLAAEKEHARILRLVSAPLAAKFTDLLPPYVDALRVAERWQELDTFLTAGGIDGAFPKARKLLWQTEARAKLDPDPAPPRQMLLRLIEEGGRGDDVQLTFQTGELAERLGHWDLAQRCFASLGDKHPPIRLAMLAKVYDMANHQHDGNAMLQACTRLAALKPEDPGLRWQKLYLKVLLGVDMEAAEPQLQSLATPEVESASKSSALTDKRHLAIALQAYRQGRMEGVREALPKVTSPATLTAGERAVYAGLLRASGGDAAAVFRILEKIPSALLLPEERRFAERGMH